MFLGIRTIIAILGLTTAFGNSDAGPYSILPDGRSVTCSSVACSVASKVDTSFHWTPELRAMAKPKVPKTKHSPNHTSTEAKAQSCPTPERITDFSAWPVKAIGRINFQNAHGAGFSCSGAFVGSYDVVLTAGHCCWEDGSWHKNWEIVLGYDNGGGTSYEVDGASVSKGWEHNDPDYMYDYCFLKTKSQSQSYLGYHIDVNFAQNQWDSIDAYGYAANYGDAKELYVAHSTYSQHSVVCSDANDACYYHADCNPMHHGNSGGPWFANDRVVGVNSHHDGGDTATQEYSPFLGTTFLKSCQYAGGCKDHMVMKDGSFMQNSSFSSQVIV